MDRKIFNVLFISVFASMLGIGIIAPLMAIYAESLNATGLWLGLIFGSFSISRAVLMPYIGRWSDTKEKKDLMLAGLAFYALSSLGYIWAGDVWDLFWVRFIHGAASAATVPIAFAYIGEVTPKGQEGRYMGIFSMSLFLGMGLGPLTGGIINDTLGIDYVFYSMGILSLFALVLILLFLPRGIGQVRQGKPVPFKKMLGDPVIRGIFLVRITGSFGMGAIMVFLPLLAEFEFGVTSSQIGLLLTANILITAFLQGPLGPLADRYDKVRMIYAGTILTGIPLFLMPLSSNFNILFFLGIIMGLGGAITMPPSSALTVIAGKTHGMGGVMGLLNTAMSIGMIISPILAGLIMDLLGLEAVFYMSGIITFTGIFALMGIRDRGE